MVRNILMHSLGLSTFCLLFLILSLLVPANVSAKNPYEVHRLTEGDPGDGVLEPVAPPMEEPDHASSLILPTFSLLSGELFPVFRFPIVVFPGHGAIGPVYLIPYSYPALNDPEWIPAGAGTRAGRGW